MERFDEIRYERPDFGILKERAKAVEEAVKAEAPFEEIDKLYDELQNYGNYCLSMATYKYIESFIDGTDEEVSREASYVLGEVAASNAASLNEALLTSPYRAHFEEKNGKFYLESMEKKQALFRAGEEYAVKEQEILAKIHKLASDMLFDLDGEKVSASKLGTLKNSPDAEVRRSARHAERVGFAENGEAFGKLLGELVEARHKLATANGFKNYLEYINIVKDRLSYGEAQLREFSDNVKKIILPIVEQNNKALQKRLGLSTYTTDDTDVYFTDGNAMPARDDLDFAQDCIQKMYDDMSPVLGNTFRRMRDNGYLKLDYSDKKVTGIAFSVEMPQQKIPFIYANYLGSCSDLNDIIHESGHAMQIQLSIDKYDDQDLHGQVQDLKEVPSKTMELISLEYADLFFGKDAEKYRQGMLAEFLDDISGYCKWFDFETFIYENPDATAQERIDKFNELYELYAPGVEIMDRDLLARGAALYRGFNIFGLPRYVITYSLCNLSAIYLANEFKKDKKKGTDLFIKLGEIGGSMDYNEAISYMGLKSSFSEEVIREVGDFLAKELRLTP
jgi:M3 family oligoendopeptidase